MIKPDDDRLKCDDYHEPWPKHRGYIEFLDWAEQMSKTHTQERCPVCGRFVVWKPKESETTC